MWVICEFDLCQNRVTAFAVWFCNMFYMHLNDNVLQDACICFCWAAELVCISCSAILMTSSDNILIAPYLVRAGDLRNLRQRHLWHSFHLSLTHARTHTHTHTLTVAETGYWYEHFRLSTPRSDTFPKESKLAEQTLWTGKLTANTVSDSRKFHGEAQRTQKLSKTVPDEELTPFTTTKKRRRQISRALMFCLSQALVALCVRGKRLYV